MNDPITFRSLCLSTVCHVCLLVWAWWSVSTIPPLEPLEPPEPKPEAPTESPRELIPVPLTRPPVPADAAPAASLTVTELPELDATALPPPEIPVPRQFSATGANDSRGEDVAAEGRAISLPDLPSVGDHYRSELPLGRDQARQVDRELEQFNLAQGTLGLFIQQQYLASRWAERYDARLGNRKLLLQVRLNQRQEVVSARIVPGQGTGIEDLDTQLVAWLIELHRSGHAMGLSRLPASPDNTYIFAVKLPAAR